MAATVLRAILLSPAPQGSDPVSGAGPIRFRPKPFAAVHLAVRIQPIADVPSDRRAHRPRHPLSPRSGTAYVYVAPCRYEDILKLGFSRDPLERLQSLHPRWYDFFDSEAGWLIETDGVREARALELQLRAPLAGHNAPSPLVILRAAAGHTEWFRGALPALAAASAELEALGHVLHRPIHRWLQPRLEQHGSSLWHWSEQMLQAIEQADHLGDDSTTLHRRLLNALDAYPALGLDVEHRVPAEVLDWHRRHSTTA
jgi:hypothetical protein